MESEEDEGLPHRGECCQVERKRVVMKWGGLPGRVRVAMLGGGDYMQGAPGRVRVARECEGR